MKGRKGKTSQPKHSLHLSDPADIVRREKKVEAKALDTGVVAGKPSAPRLDKAKRGAFKDGGKADHWMQDVHPKKGALHRQLGIPAGEKIPAKTLEKATHSSNPLLKKRAVLAETYKHSKH